MSDIVLEIPFFGGIDEATRDEYIEPGQAFRALVNVRQDHRGALSKRLGYDQLPVTRFDGSARAAGNRIVVNGDQLGVIDGTTLDIFSENLARAVPVSRVPEATYRHLEIPAVPANGASNPEIDDIVVVNGYLFVSHLIQGIGNRIFVIDASTNVVVHGPVTLDSADAQRIGLAKYGNYAVAVYSATSNTLVAKYLDTTSAATIAVGWQAFGASIASDYEDDTDIAVATLAGNDRIAIAYANTSAELSVKTLDTSGVVEATTITTGAVPEVFGLSEGGDTLWITWCETSDVKACGLNPSSIDTTTATTATVMTVSDMIEKVEVVPRANTGGTAAVYVETSTLSPNAPAVHTRAIKIESGAASTDGAVTSISNAVMQSRPFLHGGRVYGHFSSDTGDELILCDCTPDTPNLRPVASPVQRGNFQKGTFGSSRLARTAATSSTTLLHAYMVKKSGVTVGPALVEYNFADITRWKPIELNGSTYLSGGVESVFDGSRVFEAGFLIAPSIREVKVDTAGALTFTKGGRKYVAVYEEVDADGNWHVSGVSAPSAATGNIASKHPAVRVRPLSITSRGPSTRIAVYGTLDGGEAPYYRVETIENDPSAPHATVFDYFSDLSLASHELLYGTGFLPGTGAGQDHRAPPGLVVHTVYNGMIVGASGRTLFFTAAAIDGEGAWFSPVFTSLVAEDVTALESQDSTLYAFSRRSIFALTGEAPSANGLVGGLGTPYRLSADVGCINANSVVVTSLGIFFQSTRGIEVLARGGVVTWIGEKVQNTLARYPIITSAVLDDRNGLVRFSLAEGVSGGRASGEGRDLVFDLASQQWQSVDDKTGSTVHQSSQDAAMVVVAGVRRYGWLGADGTVYVERLPSDADAHLDGTSWISMRAETSWVHIAGIQGEQVIERILHLSSFHTDHGIVRSVFRDYMSTDLQVTSWTWEELVGRQWLDKELAASRGQAVRVVLEDAEPVDGEVSSGKGSTWVCLSFVGVPHRGPRRTSAAERGG